MVKLLVILLIGLAFESAGVVMLKKGITQIGEVKAVSVSEVTRAVAAGATNPRILLGVFFEALFFASLLILMAKSDISFLWPLTGLSFVFATFAAMMFLHEQVSLVRWAGVVLIMFGAALISYSEHARKEPAGAAPSNDGNLAVLGVLFLIIEIYALVMGLALARSITGSVHQLFAGTQRVRQGDFSHKIKIATRDQMGELAESFNTMTASIEDLLRQAEEQSPLLERRLWPQVRQ